MGGALPAAVAADEGDAAGRGSAGTARVGFFFYI